MAVLAGADGVDRRIDVNRVELLAAMQASVVLPLPSYTLNAVEKYVGFERTLPEANGEWSMALFIEAAETGDRRRRDMLIEQIGRYNREDLDATWAVLQWLLARAAGR